MTIVLLEALSFGLGRLADAAEEAGERLILLTGDRSIYAHELSAAASLSVVDIDTFDESACLDFLACVPDLTGLISSTDTWAVPGARIAEGFALPGLPVPVVEAVRDKERVRALLHARGLSTGVAVPVSRIAEIGFPAVVKDSSGTSSRDVWLVRDDAELAEVLERADPSILKGRLIAEPFLTGPVYSAETLTFDGSTRLLGVTSRQMSRLPWFREESAAFPVSFPDKEADRLREWVCEVLSAVGFTRGFAHIEFALTADGPEVVEINGRIGGALVGEALCRSLGVNVYRAMIDLALGRRPALLDEEWPGGPAVAFGLVYPETPGVLTGWAGLDALTSYPGDVEWFPTAAVGQDLRHVADQRGCTGIVLAHGETAELAAHRAVSAAGSITPRMQPPGS